MRLAFLLFLVACGGDPAPPPSGTPSTASGPVTLRTFFIDNDGGMGGVLGADDLCQTDASNPDPAATWKALLASGDRTACTSVDCSEGMAGQADWVLAPNTTYERPEGGTLGTTDANGVITSYPLDAPVLDGAGTNFWTNLTREWLTHDADCNGWTTANPEVTGRLGWSAGIDNGWIDGGTFSCERVRPVLCVEQP